AEKQCGCDAEIMAIGRDDGAPELALERCLNGTKGADFINAILVFGDAVTHRRWSIKEHGIKVGAVIGEQCGLIGSKHRLKFGFDLRDIDFHQALRRATIRWRRRVRKGMVSNWSGRTLSQSTPIGRGMALPVTISSASVAMKSR